MNSFEARSLAIGAVASLAAGAIHTSAIAAHAEHRQAVWVFVATAIVQLAWGAWALARPRRWTAAVGVVLSVAFVAGWALAKTRGISFVDGLDEKEPVAFADGLAAGLALLTAASAGVALLVRRVVLPRFATVLAGAAIVAIAVPGTSAAVDHRHDDGHEHVATAAAPAEIPSAVPPRPFDPDLPIDLSGVEGVTPEQQARAENLLAVTLLRLPQWSDPAVAEAAGFRSIGDGSTGDEHFINLEFMDNDTILDPDEPESLVYDTRSGTRRLVAAMYMLPTGSTLDDVPDIGGALTQWHIHDNLCFTADARVAGITDAEGNCSPPLVKGPETPMIHVWIEPQPCGPFSALEGIGGGQIAEGEVRACDHVHGDS